MESRVTCGRCAHSFTLEEESTAQQNACPSCGSTMLFRQLPATRGPSESAQPDGEPAARPTPAEAPAEAPESHSAARDSNDADSPAEKSEPKAVPVSAAIRDQRSVRFLLPASAWILFAAIVATVGVMWAVYSVFRGGVRETAQAPQGESSIGPESPIGPESAAAQQAPAGTPRTEPESAAASQPEDDLIEASSPKPRIASSLEEVKEALVKIEMPLGVGDLMEIGTGFLIDRRGWIATNQHVAAHMTKDSRVKLADGTLLEIAGVVARAPGHDLAIVQLKEPPAELTILDIRYEGRAPLGEDVYAFGHPYGAEFSLTKGIVSRNLTTAEFPNSSRLRLPTKLRPPDDMEWIQHDAKISPGNSGGPLIDETGRVFGINTFVHLKAEFGYASHVKHLCELADAVSDPIEPLPDRSQVRRNVVTNQRISELFDAVSAFDWKPATAEQYENVAELAKQMTLAKHARAVRRRGSDRQSAVVERVARVADQKFAALGNVSWNDEKFKALNAFAGDQMNNALEGVILYCSVLKSAPDLNSLLMEISGTRDLFLLRVGPNMTKAQRGSRWLVLGFVMPQVGSVRSRNQPEARPARLVLTHYMIKVR